MNSIARWRGANPRRPVRDNNPANARHTTWAPSGGITAGGVIATHDAEAAARSTARRTTTSNTATTATAATAVIVNTGQQAPMVCHSDLAARSNHPAGSVPPSHNNEPTGDCTPPQSPSIDRNPSRDTIGEPDPDSAPEVALAAPLITATGKDTNDPPNN
jgi:hypothetical protein